MIADSYKDRLIGECIDFVSHPYFIPESGVRKFHRNWKVLAKFPDAIDQIRETLIFRLFDEMEWSLPSATTGEVYNCKSCGNEYVWPCGEKAGIIESLGGNAAWGFWLDGGLCPKCLGVTIKRVGLSRITQLTEGLPAERVDVSGL